MFDENILILTNIDLKKNLSTIKLMKEGGIYLHIPFCRNKCIYCDFYSGGSRIADWDRYPIAVTKELKTRVDKELTFLPTTLYLGGGTPSLIPEEVLRNTIESINEITGNSQWKEFTIEVNPEDVTAKKCKTWKETGINRVSIGIQSLNDLELSKIGRRHSALMGEKAIDLLSEYFHNVSVDVMFGIPDQTLTTYEKTIEKIISKHPTHISSYSLMLEPGTAMTLLHEKGKLPLPEEEQWMKMFELTTIILDQSGYKRYEISNYALEGFESLHNQNYWLGKPYIGLGPSAHSYDGEKIRRANPNDLKGYLDFFENPGFKNEAFYTKENLTEGEQEEEMIMTRLRLIKGLDINLFGKRFGEKKRKNLLQKAIRYINQGLMKEEKGYLKFTDKGFIISDALLCNLI